MFKVLFVVHCAKNVASFWNNSKHGELKLRDMSYVKHEKVIELPERRREQPIQDKVSQDQINFRHWESHTNLAKIFLKVFPEFILLSILLIFLFFTCLSEECSIDSNDKAHSRHDKIGPFWVTVFSQVPSSDTSSDASNTLSHPCDGHQILWSIGWIFPSLYAHNGINHDINES